MSLCSTSSCAEREESLFLFAVIKAAKLGDGDRVRHLGMRLVVLMFWFFFLIPGLKTFRRSTRKINVITKTVLFVFSLSDFASLEPFCCGIDGYQPQTEICCDGRSR